MSFSKLKSVLAQMMVIYIVIKWIGLLSFTDVCDSCWCQIYEQFYIVPF